MYVVQCHSPTKETEVLPFATNMDGFRKYIDLSRVIQTQSDKYNVVVWNLKINLTNEYNKIETDSWIQNTDRWLKMRRKGQGKDRGLRGTSHYI